MGGKKFDRAGGLVSSPPPHARLTLQPLRAGLRVSRSGCVRIELALQTVAVRSPATPQRQRASWLSREDRSLTAPGGDPP